MSTQEFRPNGSLSPAENVLAMACNWGLPEEPAQEQPNADKPEVFKHNGGYFELAADGVRWFDDAGKPTRVCEWLRVEARSRDPKGQGWGLLLRWRDGDGREHSEVLSSDTLHAESNEAVKQLALGGLAIASGSKLRTYLTTASNQVKERVRFVQQAGWHGDTYVTPEQEFASAAPERVRLEDGSGMAGSLGSKGDAQSWQGNVAALARGNSRLVFAICCPFAGPMLGRAGVESGGFHFQGSSSAGKTTALRRAASASGCPERVILTWRATSNGLEGIAARHNDGLLILDELSQCDGKEAGAAAYMLANGKGKARATRTGGAREAASWRVLLLSSGEVSLATHMQGAGKRANAGQELRLVNIPADAGMGMGMFEDLHGYASPSAFADALKAACDAHHGTAGPAFLSALVEDFAATGTDAGPFIKAMEDFVREVVPQGAAANGQVMRVARRFALVAAAGELATDYGVTGWEQGEAYRSAAACFRAWLEGFGEGSHEDRAAVELVLAFLEKHGSSRFEKKDGTGEKVYNRAGFYEEENGIRLYHVLPEAFKETVAGHDPVRAAKALLAKGMLRRGDKLMRVQRLPGMGPTRVYTIALSGEEQL